MTEDQDLEFQEWAEARGMPLDCYFFEDGQPYEDPAVQLAFEAWQGALDSAGLKPPHHCEKIASALMDEGRDWWVGRLLEPVAEHPQETHCLHLRTPLKDVVFLVNDADFQWLTILGRAACGALNEQWLDSVTKGAMKRAGTS